MNRPNVIYVYPDEMRYDATSFAGNQLCKTPAIDALAGDGAGFTSAYTSFPLCCPFRASVMTGKYAHKNGMFANHYPIPLDQTFLPSLMKDAGYYTGWIGKWHLNGGNKFDPVEKEYQLGFDEFVGYGRGHHYLNSVYYRGEDKTPHKSDKFEPEYQTDQLLEFVDHALEKEQPFLGMICYGLPHHPVDMQPDYYKNMFSKDDIVLSATTPPWMVEEAKAYRAKYLGMVKCVDDQIKALTDGLKARGVYDNTLFVLVSDHGDMCLEHGVEDKHVAFESSAHVPFFITCPNLIPANTVINQMVDPAIAIMPTILDFCGIDIPDCVDGKSLKAALTTGHDETLPDHSYFQILKTYEKATAVYEGSDRRPFPERGFRTKDYLYVESCGGTPFMLFDLQKDKDELYNCVNSFHYFDMIMEFHEKLATMMAEKGDDWSIGTVEYPGDLKKGDVCTQNYANAYANATYE